MPILLIIVIDSILIKRLYYTPFNSEQLIPNTNISQSDCYIFLIVKFNSNMQCLPTDQPFHENRCRIIKAQILKLYMTYKLDIQKTMYNMQ